MYEGLISLDLEPLALLRNKHGIAIREIAQEVSHIAAFVGNSPLLSVQCPAQGPLHHEIAQNDIRERREGWGSPSTLVIRFLIALRNTSAEKRERLTRSLINFCEVNGLGLWLKDRRLGYRSGNWFNLQPHDEKRAHEYLNQFGGNEGDRQVRWILPLTLVGPARVGSTYAVINFLSCCDTLGIV
jgi:hypothetical protein